MSGTVFAENEVREEVIGEPLRAPETVLPYKPKLPDEQSEEFYAAVYAAYEAGFPVNAQSTERQVARLDAAAQRAIVQRQGAKRRGDKQKADDVAFLIAALLLLRDLLQIGWTLAIQGTEIRLHRKALSDDKAEAKQQIRQSMMFERKESMNGASVRSFIRDMEKVRHHNGQDVSVLSLVADGIQLHTGLTEAAALPEAERLIRLKETVKPYLHLVEGDLRDPFTNLRLIDIWRYFRLTWSTPYRPTPGRNVFYLVRDAGQPNHPVIGIAALANVIIGIRCRDDRIGWTTEALAARLAEAKTRDTELVGQGKPDEAQNFDNTCWQIAGMLETHLEKGLSLIDISGITTRNEVTYPTSEGVAAIWKIADDATEARYQHLKDEAVLDNFDPEEFELELQGNIPAKKAREQRDSSAALFLRKRAEKLAGLLQAKLLFLQKNVFENAPAGLPLLIWNDKNWKTKNDAGRTAIRTILNANKDSKIGSSMMEIVVCGAIAPYSYLLGGKLVAMLLASPEVVADYERRYGNQASTIASQVAGRDIKRAAHLVFLGTSSLYVDAGDTARYEAGKKKGFATKSRFSSASQYNRIRIPASVAGGGEKDEVRYECLGMTEGFGVVHFATDTREALEELDIIRFESKRVNSLFGEGTSPRLRKIRQGIGLLGLSDEFLIHGQKRLVYGINLAKNTERYLAGADSEPQFFIPLTEPKRATEKIGQYWVERWLSMRINHQPTMEKVAAFRPDDIAVSRELDDGVDVAPTNLDL